MSESVALDYNIVIDKENAEFLRMLLVGFAKKRKTMKKRSMINMEPINPKIYDNKNDRRIAEHLLKACDLCSDEDIEEYSMIGSLAGHYVERARSFMFYKVSDIVKNRVVCDLKEVDGKNEYLNCTIRGINDQNLLAIEIERKYYIDDKAKKEKRVPQHHVLVLPDINKLIKKL